MYTKLIINLHMSGLVLNSNPSDLDILSLTLILSDCNPQKSRGIIAFVFKRRESVTKY